MNLFHKVKPYFLPKNVMDNSISGRIKRGLINYSQVNSWWSIGPLKTWIRKKDFEFKCRIDQTNIRLCASGGDITHLWVADEILVDRVYDLSLVPFCPEFIFDMGANIGLFSLVAGKKWPDAKILCLEPHPATFRYLIRNLDRNNVKAALFQCALDSHSGVKYLNNVGAVFQTLTNQSTNTFVHCLKLDGFLEMVQSSQLLMKMDIEGAEEGLLDSLFVKFPERTFIFIELHRGDDSIAWVEEWACKHAFVFVAVRRRDLAIDGYLLRKNL
jgi:FkbM family methyltransferase